jgi:NAD(P)-dependent dehydrogenase (short-subunit alcohol dehydrogenase family)
MTVPMKTVLITGAAQGVGLATAAQWDGGWVADASWNSLRLRTRG